LVYAVLRESIFVLNSNCLLETHLMQRYAGGSILKFSQSVLMGVRNMLRPQAVFDAKPIPPLFKCI